MVEILLVEVFSKPTADPEKRRAVVRAYVLPDPQTARKLVEEKNTVLMVVEKEMEIGKCKGDEDVIEEDIDFPYQDVILVLHRKGICFRPIEG